DLTVTGVQTCALPICHAAGRSRLSARAVAHLRPRAALALSGAPARRHPGGVSQSPAPSGAPLSPAGGPRPLLSWGLAVGHRIRQIGRASCRERVESAV